MNNRHLDWQGCLNARDLGGIRLPDGRQTLRRAFVRADAPTKLTDEGWRSLHAYGIGTIIDLRHERERAADASLGREGITSLRVPLEDLSDTEFWVQWSRYNCCPLYYRPFLERFPQRIAAVFAALATNAGCVLIHCGIGRDRTGLISLLLLALAGVEPKEIATDYELSADRLQRYEEQQVISNLLANHGTTAEKTIVSLLESIDVQAYLDDAGVSRDEIAAVKEKLTGRLSFPECPGG